MPVMSSFSAKHLFITIFALVAVCLGTYYNAVSVPFYLDDISSITSNPRFSDATTYTSLLQVYGMRVVGYISLWWDYQSAGLDVSRYHYVNNSIHALMSVSIFAFVYLLQLAAFRVPKTVTSEVDNHDHRKILWISAAVALLFAVHPLNTQAVTYIVQRLASLTALFYMLCITSYLGFRLTQSIVSKLVLLALTLVFAVLAVLTKQNAVTLPLAIILLELVFFNQLKLKHLAVLAGLSLLAAVGFYSLVPELFHQIVATVDQMTRENKIMTRWEYFTTQLPILWMYIAKAFYPFPLHLEYTYTLETFSLVQKWLAGIAHLIMLAAAILFVKRLPLLSFGVLFFYLAHSVESGIIPITDLVFEHRTYLPNVGLLLALVSLVVLFLEKLAQGRQWVAAASVLALATVTLSSLTVLRNQQWQSPPVFFAHELTYSPTHPRTLHSIAEIMVREGKHDMAMQHLNRLYEVSDGKIDGVMLNTHLSILINQGQYDEALALGKRLLSAKSLHPSARSVILANMGIVYVNLQQHATARPYFDQAVQFGSMSVNSLLAYGYTLYVLDDLAVAQKVVSTILKIQPGEAKAKQLALMIQAKAAVTVQ